MPTPVEALLFENKTDDPHYNLRVGVDVQFRGFEVSHIYKDKTIRQSIGIASAAHYFTVESDENITKCYVTGKHKVEGLRFLTDKGQHFIVGRIGQNEKILARGGRNGETLQGFHCQWSNKNTSDSALTSFGVFTLDDVTWRLGGEREDKDSRGFYWIPNRISIRRSWTNPWPNSQNRKTALPRRWCAESAGSCAVARLLKTTRSYFHHNVSQYDDRVTHDYVHGFRVR